MLLLSFVLCIMHPFVSCQAVHATGLLPYAIIYSLAVSTDHWFPPKTAVAQNPRQVPNRYSALCWRPVTQAQTRASYSTLYRFGILSWLRYAIVTCDRYSTLPHGRLLAWRYTAARQPLLLALSVWCREFSTEFSHARQLSYTTEVNSNLWRILHCYGYYHFWATYLNLFVAIAPGVHKFGKKA